MNPNPPATPAASAVRPESIEVRLRSEQRRYTAVAGDRVVGFAEYSRIGRKMLFTHTEVDEAIRRHGVAGVLVERALDDVRARGLVVRPLCAFVAAWINQHPDYLDLVDPIDRERMSTTT